MLNVHTFPWTDESARTHIHEENNNDASNSADTSLCTYRTCEIEKVLVRLRVVRWLMCVFFLLCVEISFSTKGCKSGGSYLITIVTIIMKLLLIRTHCM